MKEKILALLLILIGLVFFILGAVGLAEGLASRAWIEVEAKVEKSEMSPAIDRGGKGRARYEALITYTYRVQGVAYTGTEVGLFAYGTGRSRHVQKLVSDYPKGGTVKAYHHPRHPENAVLIRGVSHQVYITIVMGLGPLGMGIYLTVWILKQRWSPRRQPPKPGSGTVGFPHHKRQQIHKQ